VCAPVRQAAETEIGRECQKPTLKRDRWCCRLAEPGRVKLMEYGEL